MLKPLVLDATPIIYLCKIGLSYIFNEFPEEKFTVPKVMEQVVTHGKKLGAPDAFIAEDIIRKSIIKVKEPKNIEFTTLLSYLPDLHPGEVEVLALAKDLNGIAVIDESIAREVARIYGIEAHGTAYLLLRLFYRGKLTRKQIRDAVNQMISAGWRLTAEDYAKLMRELET